MEDLSINVHTSSSYRIGILITTPSFIFLTTHINNIQQILWILLFLGRLCICRFYRAKQFLTPKLVKSYDKKRLVIVCLLLIGVFHSAPYALYKIGLTPAAGSNEIIQFLSIFLFLTGIFSIMSLMVRESMIPDVVDEIHAYVHEFCEIAYMIFSEMYTSLCEN